MAISSKSTQEFVPIKEVRDGVIVLKDGSLRLILMVSSLNIALKSEDEQMALLLQFQNVLNSLDFSVQIFVQSRRLDIRPYLALLETRLHEQLDDLLKIQTKEYVDFIKNLTETSNIMTKNFFIVVPYSAAAIGGVGSVKFPLGLGGGARSPDEKKRDSMEEFEESRTQLDQRASVVAQGMSSMGLRVVELGTEEVIELFYKLFNPGEMEKPMKIEK